MNSFNEKYDQFIDIFIAKLNKNLRKRYHKKVQTIYNSSHTFTYKYYLDNCFYGPKLQYRELDSYCILHFDENLTDLVSKDDFYILATGLIYSFEYYFKKSHKLNLKLEQLDSEELPFKTKFFPDSENMLWCVIEIQIEGEILGCYFLFSVDHLTMLFDQPKVNKQAV